MPSSTSISRMLVTLASVSLLTPAALADQAPASSRRQPQPPQQVPQPPQQAPQPQPGTRAPVARPPTAPPGAPAQAPLPRVQLAPIDVAIVPPACASQLKQAQSPTLAVALPARISLASCMAERATAPLELCDCGASIAAIDSAAAPAIALLDDVIAHADPATRVIAEHAQGQLYAGFVIRLVATLPPVGPTAAEAELALRDMRKQTLELQLTPWREAAMASFQHVVDAARANPALMKNPVVTTAVRDSEQRLSAEVASR